MDVNEAIRSRRSCRSYADAAVPPALVEEIIDAGSRAPSPLNQQPWNFVVCYNAERIHALEQLAVQARDRVAEESGKDWVRKYDPSFVAQAPVVVVVTADPRKIGLGAWLGEGDAHVKAVSACIQNMLLAATARGLGGMWFTFYEKPQVRKLFDIPEERDIVGVVTLGYPGAESPEVPRKDPKELTTVID